MSKRVILCIVLVSILLFGFGCKASSYLKKGNFFNDRYSAEEATTTKIIVPLLSTPSIPEGSYNEPFRLEFTANRRAVIYYSTDPKEYKVENFKKFESPILITKDTLVRYFAKNSNSTENVKEVFYKIIELQKKESSSDDINTIENFVRNMNILSPNTEIYETRIEEATSETTEGVKAESITVSSEEEEERITSESGIEEDIIE